MAELYAENTLEAAMGAGKRAVSLGLAKQFDVHFSDACIKTVLEVNALVSGHEDGHPDPVFAANEASVEGLDAKLQEIERQPVQATEAGLSPAQIALLMQVAEIAWNLYLRWRSGA